MKLRSPNGNSLLAVVKFIGFLFFNGCMVSFAKELSYNYVPLDTKVMDCSIDTFYNFRHNHERPKVSSCISTKHSIYTFPVSAGPIFFRLYFKSITFLGLNTSKALFSVHVGQYTLLTTSESSYSMLSSGVDYVVREFCINIEDQVVNVTFIPSSNVSGAFSFFNRIEIVSMPLKLYIQENVPLPLIGFGEPSHYYSMEKSTALEMMYRLNIGGSSIPEQEDSTGMFRLWEDDSDFIRGESKSNITQSEVEIKSGSYKAPSQVYASATTILDMSDNNHKAGWSLTVDSGFYYLVRLHFCEISSKIQKDGQRVFRIYIDNHTAEEHADIFHWSHGAGIPTFRDYIVNFSVCSEGIKNISISMRRSNGSSEYPILNGLEIFKLSDFSHNLAGSHPFGVITHPHLNILGSENHDRAENTLIIIWKAVFVLLFLATTSMCWYPVLALDSKSWKQAWKQKQSSEDCRIFSFAEIKSATNNFSDTMIIGTGGFGTVYKGFIDSGNTKVAVKRANRSSRQGLNEFQTEISMLSTLRHCHLVSLIGYSMKGKEMILVYDYMAQGTLRDHLYNTQKKASLHWKKRLKICIGAARGLHYLHTGTEKTIIHRDIKSTNILLDDKLVAKVSDFGLSKIGPSLGESNTHVSTIVKGTFGYLDPEYYRRRKLTEKADVYSLGVVLFETLCARPAVMPTEELEDEEYERVNLAEWALHCYQKGTLDQMIDPYLNGKISPECFKTFTDIAIKCLADRGSDRPSMGDVVCNLELAMQQQQNASHDMEEGKARNGANDRVNDDVSINIDGEICNCFDNSDLTPGVEFSEIMVPIGR